MEDVEVLTVKEVQVRNRPRSTVVGRGVLSLLSTHRECWSLISACVVCAVSLPCPQYAALTQPNPTPYQVVEKTPESKKAKRRTGGGTKRKADHNSTKGGGKGGKKGRVGGTGGGQEELPPLNPNKIVQAHPVSV